jgi:hypothetical protein
MVVGLLVAALALALTSGVILAQEVGGTPSPNSPAKSFAARVAAKLGLQEAQVQGAFKQAAREMQDEAVKGRLSRLVERGRLTQAQADEYFKWYQSRPESMIPGPVLPGLHGPKMSEGPQVGGPHGPHFHHGPWFHRRVPLPPAPGGSVVPDSGISTQ